MTAVLLALMMAQPAPDESGLVAQQFTERMGEAYRIMEKDPEEAIRLMTALLDDPKARELEGRSPAIRVYREQALYIRGHLQVRHGGAQAVADDMTALLDRKRGQLGSRVAGLVGVLASPSAAAPLAAVLRFPPAAPLNRLDRYGALGLRAEAYKVLGRHDAERVDRAEVEEILQELKGGWPANAYRAANTPPGVAGGIEGGTRTPVSWVTGSSVVAAAFVAMVPSFLLMGLRQRRDAGGTWRRLFWVSFALAAMQTTPLLAAFLLLMWRPGLLYDSALPYGAFGVFVFNVFRHRSYLIAVKWQQAREAPPLLDDPAVLDRIAAIAGRMGIASPVTRLVRSPSSLQVNNGMIVGVAAPTMVLFDGILYRLAEEERDAIIAHELAHLANHTFWYWLIAGAACGVAAVAASALYPLLVALALEVVLVTCTRLILSRRLELDCDRRAARAIGHRRAFSALSKIHSEQPTLGLLAFLAGALNTHPSRDERLDSVRRDAPEDDRPEVEWDTRLLVLRRLASWGAVVAWLSLIAACLLWGYRSPASNWPALPLALMLVGLYVLFWLNLRETTRVNRRLQRTRWPWRRRIVWLVPILVWGFFIAQITGLTAPYLDPWASLAILLGSLATLPLLKWLGPTKANKLNHQILIAIQSGDFPKALALAEAKPAVVAGSTELRYNYALIRVVLGRRAEALADLERLRADDPGFKMTTVLLASVSACEGDYARALELAAQLSRDLPKEPLGPQLESWLLRKLGRLEEAEKLARETLELDPRSGLAHLTLAAVAFDRGDYAAAREELAVAEKLVPGSTDAALFAAEIALATDDAGAEAAVRHAVDAAKNNPLSFADKEAARLVRRFEAGRQPSPG